MKFSDIIWIGLVFAAIAVFLACILFSHLEKMKQLEIDMVKAQITTVPQLLEKPKKGLW